MHSIADTSGKLCWLAAAALAIAGCSSKTSRAVERDAAAPPAEPAPAAAPATPAPLPPIASRPALPRRSTDPLWKLAPPEIEFGAVVADGGFESIGAALAELGSVLASDPEGTALWQAFTSKLRAALGFDLHDIRRWRSVGLDPGRGGALFGTTGSDAAMVLPVGDLESFRTVFGLERREIGGVVVDVSSKLGYCLEIPAPHDRYVCADTAELLAAVAAGQTGSLGKRAMKLPETLRGTVEIVADLGAFDGARRRLRALAPALKGIGLMAVGARLGNGRMTVEAYLAGQRSGPVGEAFARLGKPRSLRPHLGGAIGVIGAHLPLDALWGDAVPGDVQIGRTDLGELVLDHLTGQLALVTRGRGLAAGTAVIGLDDTAAFERAMPDVCALLRQLVSKDSSFAAGRCHTEVAPSRAGLPVLPGLPAALRKPIPVVLSATGGAAVIAAGDTSGPPGPAPGFALEPAHVVAWGRALDPLATAPVLEARLLEVAIAGRLDAPSRRQLAVVRRLLDHVYELGVRGRLEAGGARVSIDLISFAADPAPVYAAYKIAVARLLAGDHAGYRTQIAALGAGHPDSLAGDQARMVAAATPAIGPGTALLAAIALRAWVKYTAR